MTSQEGLDERPEDPPDIAAARTALSMLAAARADGDREMIACAELLLYAAAQGLAAQLEGPQDA